MSIAERNAGQPSRVHGSAYNRWRQSTLSQEWALLSTKGPAIAATVALEQERAAGLNGAKRSSGVEELATLGESGGGIVHDFRNFLAVIESGLKLAEQSSERPERVRVYIAAARGGIARGVKLTS